MTSKTIKLVLYYVTIVLIEWLAQTIAQDQYASYGNQSKGTSRNVYYTTTLDKDISRRSKSSTELPVAFKAPNLGSQNFWNSDPQRGADRRTFFEDFKYLNYGNSNVFPKLNSFFEFMSPLIYRENPIKPKQPPISKPSEPYKYEYPFKYVHSTERNFLPPPKPLRASIVKLETVTKLPDWQLPYDYVTSLDTLKHFSNYQNRPNGKRPSLHIDELGFHSDNNMNFRKGSNWLTQKFSGETTPPVFESSDEVQTTQSPLASTELNLKNELTSKTRQGAAENNQLGENVSTFKTTQNIAANDNLNGEGKGSVSSASTALIQSQEGIKHRDDVEDSKNVLKLVINNTINKYNKLNNGNNNNNATSKVNENVEGTVLSKTTNHYKKSNTIKIVTDLTLEGLQKNRKDTFNVPRYTKYLNMSNLIRYELNKLKQSKLMIPRYDVIEHQESEVRKNQEGHHVSYTNTDGSVNDSDDLSLDLKILKDTNWDGFTTQSVNTHFPTVNNINYGPTITDAKTELPNLVIQSSTARNIHKNSMLTSIEKNIDNKTIIVETRVTSSISKRLPDKNRMNRRKAFKVKRVQDLIQKHQEGDYMKEKDGSDKPQIINVKADVAAHEVEINGVGNITFPTTAEENEKIQTEEKGAHFHKSVLRLGKKFYVLQDYSSSQNQRDEGLNHNNGHQKRQYRPHVRNPNTFSNNTKEAMLYPSSEISEQNKESLNATSCAEKNSNGETFIATDTSQSNKIENIDGTHISRMKPKRKKLKRRRTGKRRNTPKTTEKIGNTPGGSPFIT